VGRAGNACGRVPVGAALGLSIPMRGRDGGPAPVWGPLTGGSGDWAWGISTGPGAPWDGPGGWGGGPGTAEGGRKGWGAAGGVHVARRRGLGGPWTACGCGKGKVMRAGDFHGRAACPSGRAYLWFRAAHGGGGFHGPRGGGAVVGWVAAWSACRKLLAGGAGPSVNAAVVHLGRDGPHEGLSACVRLAGGWKAVLHGWGAVGL